LIQTYLAGSTTPVATYTDVGLSSLNQNPIQCDSAGRCTIFLTPGTSYKFVFMTAASVVLRTQDNITATPLSTVNVDVTGTAGETLTAGDFVWLSDGSGSTTNGRWYKTSATNTYSSNDAGEIGIVIADIASAATGTIRLLGTASGLSGLVAGSDYFLSATAGLVTSTAPTNRRYVGRADSTTTLVLGPAPRSVEAQPVDNTVNDFRLTLTTALPITTADVTGATNVFLTPYRGNRIALYDGTNWVIRTSAELTQALGTLTSGIPYDVFCYATASTGAPATEILAWTNGTTRATALTLQDGVLVKTGAVTRRYLGTFVTTSTTQTEDSFANRYLWNYYHRVRRPMRVMEATDTWNYTTAVWRQARATATNQIGFVIGWAEIELEAQVLGYGANATVPQNIGVAIGLDSTTTPTTGNIGMFCSMGVASIIGTAIASLRVFPAVGLHYAAWLENGLTATGTTAWYGDNGTPTTTQAGISGSIHG
jgi:hypothetical protein